MTITDIDLDQLEATAKAATPDTWYAYAAARPEVVLALIERLRKAEVVTEEQRDCVADHVWDQMIGVAKSSVREVIADAFASACIRVSGDSEAAETPRVVTDAQVEAGARAISPRPDHWKDYLNVSRKVLEAAQEVRS